MNKIAKLAEYFSRFPGIGPRQSKRFVYFLLTQPSSFHTELAKLLKDLGSQVSQCSLCHRFFTMDGVDVSVCDICSSQNRNKELILIVEKDVDLDNIERSKVYKGQYFVLGGIIPILEKEPERKIRTKELSKRVKDGNFKEIILALSTTPDGDNTSKFIQEFVKKLNLKNTTKISELGRGLSTGSELEYSDMDTIKNALENRH